jgi:malate permease and related proteins
MTAYFCIMYEVIIKIVPVLLLFLCGFLLKISKTLREESGDVLLRIVFYLSLPALIVHSISTTPLLPEHALLPLSATLIIFATFAIVFTILPLFKLQKKSAGVFVIGSLILNCGFLIPFVHAVYGKEGLALLLIFDFANALLVYSLIYYLACRFSENKKKNGFILKKLLLSPPLWALITAILINLLHVRIPSTIDSFLKITGDTAIPFLMLALGLFFNPKLVRLKVTFSVLLIRFAGGLLLGLLLSAIFRLQGLSKIIVILGAASPVGFNTLTFASLEELDKPLAASLVSYGVLIGIFLTPLLILIFG